MAKYDSILDTIGNTPCVKINKLAPEGINLYVKMESFNPGGSIKDRLALGVILDAEMRGVLKPGQTVIEATSGNTGIGLAIVCAARGYPLVVTMAESFSVERRKIMRFLGAKVVLTPASEKGSGMLNKAIELSQKHGWYLARQFENEANADIHTKTTAEEILTDFPEGLDYWFTGFGTGGTLKGIARVLKDKSPKTKVMVCEPDNVPLLGSKIKQERDEDGAPVGSHPMFRPHLMQGWSPDFIPKLAEDAVEAGYIDGFVPIDGNDALRLSKELAQKEGIFVGTTAGATFAGALEVAKTAPKGSTILAMLPDTGERYLTTQLFEDISEDMSDAEIEVSKSTPNFRFDVSSAPAPTKPKTEEKPVELDSDTEKFVDEVVSDKKAPVVMFALEWCEFCKSVRQFLDAIGVEFKSIDLDSVSYQKEDKGLKVRAILASRTGQKTIPQIYIGGEHIGGGTDVFDAWKEGGLQKLLGKNDIKFNSEVDLDPYSVLPTWMHPR